MRPARCSLPPVASALLIFTMLSPLAISAQDQSEPNALTVHVQLDEAMSSATAKVGQEVPIHVSEAVMKDGKEVIAAGGPVRAYVTRVKQPSHGDRDGQIKLVMTGVQTSRGNWAPLHGGKARRGHRFIALVAGPCSVPFPLTMLMVGQEVTIPKGQLLMAYVKARDLQ